MKKTLLKNSILAITLLLTSASLNAQSVLNASVFGFELGTPTTVANGDSPSTGIYIPGPSETFITFSTTQYVSAPNSLKLYSADAATVDYSVQIGNSTSLTASKTTFTAGTYDLKAMIYIVSNPPATIPFAFSKDDALGNVFKNIVLPVTTTETNKWVEISLLNTELTAYTDAKVTIKIPRTTAMLNGGATEIYLDNFTLTPSTTTSVKNATTLAANVYVNQSAKSITVNSKDGSDVNVYSISGSVVKSFKNVSASFETSVSGLAKGLYLVKVTNNGSSFVQKIQL